MSKPGNTKLFSLLCKIRSYVCDGLVQILIGAFGVEEEADSDKTEPMLFGGCYFAATGEGETRRAFVGGIFRKIQDLQGELAWTKKAVDEDRRYQSATNIIWLLVGVLLVAMAVMLLIYFF